MDRIITKRLVEWKNQRNRKPLILRGARQVGKTWAVIDFGTSHFNGNVHVVDLEKRLEWHKGRKRCQEPFFIGLWFHPLGFSLFLSFSLYTKNRGVATIS